MDDRSREAEHVAVRRAVVTDAPALVRPARAADLDAVVAIERASFADPWAPRAFSDALADEGLLFLVAEGEQGVAGYVIAWFVAGDGEIANIAVAPPARGHGVGAALLDAALRVGRDCGTRCVFLEVRESNAVARALYASRHFVEVGRRRGYYRLPTEDAIVLRRSEGRG
jgi:[ribosomal protein S18]-alanine N-acetyltransferase